MATRILSLIIIILITSCSQQNPRTFTAKEIGWTVEIPQNWKIDHQRIVKEDIDDGAEIVRKTADEDFELSGKEISLLLFRKNELSKFQASIVPFNESYQNEWHDKYPLVRDYIYNIFKAQGFRVDSTSTKERIAGINFEVFNMNIFQNNKQVMEQNMYRSYINGYDFIINMTNDNKAYKAQMLDVLRKSTIKK